MVGIDHYFHTWWLNIRPHFPKSRIKQNKFQVKVGTVGLAEGIIDDTHVL